MWRRLASAGIPPGSPFETPNDGNRIFDIDAVFQIIENNNVYYRVVFDSNIYLQDNAVNGADFGSSLTRDWHEPVYVINLIRRDAQVPSSSIDRYVNTGHHIKIESCIGIGTGQPQTVQLLNERPEDVFDVNGGNRYIYIQSGGEVTRWMCWVNNSYLASLTPAQISVLVADLNAGIPFADNDGNLVHGLYGFNQGDWLSSGQIAPFASITFGSYGVLTINCPPLNSRILVRYDSRSPIRFFGGDVTIAPATSCIINDFHTENSGYLSVSNDRKFVPRLPYSGWYKSPEYNAVLNANPSLFSSGWCSLIISMRQWVVLWDAEQRSAKRYAKGTNDTAIGGPYEWPKIGYIIKPYIYVSANPLDGMFQYPLVNVDGTDVDLNQTPRNRGGVLFTDGYNKDYWKQPFVSGFGVPFDEIGGYQEKTYFPTGLISSLEVDPLLRDVPGLRTFVDGNLKVVSEENGEIKTIASVLGGGGRNMYAITERGVVRVLTNKNILTGASGEVISTQSIANYWGEEMWLSRNIGSPDQMWQFFVKGFATMGSSYADSFFWADRNSVYRMVGDQIIDIGRNRFLSFLLPKLRTYPDGYVVGVNGFYNRKYNEAWMTLVDRSGTEDGEQTRTPPKLLVVYNADIDNWVGVFTYRFDAYAQVGNDIFGHRDLETYRVDVDNNYTISGDTREATITVPMTGDLDSYKEFLRWRISGDIALSKPDKIQILDPQFNVMCEMPGVGNTSPYWVKHYDGWEGWADRTLSSYDPDRKLPQNQYFYLRLIWNTAADKAATAMSGQLKPIK